MLDTVLYEIVDDSLDRDRCKGTAKVLHEITKLLRVAHIEYYTISRKKHIERRNYYDGYVDFGIIYKSTIAVDAKDFEYAQQLVTKAEKKIRVRSRYYPSPPSSPDYLSSSPLKFF
mmetsp:Transcript_26276/g.40303  ORF Transcript_26276/g.40303 Transcript_26276/m.40303 type:complete len:116 (-) Transcript_26276:2062-2409(-)